MNTNNDSLSIPNNILLQHEHALKVLNLTMNMGDSSMNGTNSSALSGNNTIGEQQYQQEEPQSNSHDNSNYIDFSETNKQYGNHFNAKNDVPTPPLPATEEQKESKSYEPVQLRFNSASLLKSSTAMEKSARGPVDMNNSSKNGDSSSSSNYYQAQRGNSLVDSFGETYRIVHQNTDHNSVASDGAYNYPRVVRPPAVPKQPRTVDKNKSKIARMGKVQKSPNQDKDMQGNLIREIMVAKHQLHQVKSLRNWWANTWKCIGKTMTLGIQESW